MSREIQAAYPTVPGWVIGAASFRREKQTLNA
jgi:hypothetical protein